MRRQRYPSRRFHPVYSVRARYVRLSSRNRHIVKYSGWALLAVILVQLVYPRSVMLPNTTIAGKSYSFKSKSSVIDDLKIEDDEPITVEVEEVKIPISTAQLGVRVDASKTIEPALAYSWLARLIPFTILKNHDVSDFGIVVTDRYAVQTFYKGLAKYDEPPVNAVVEIKDQKAKASPPVAGYMYSSDENMARLANLRISEDKKLTITSLKTDAPISKTMADDTAKKINKIINQPLEVTADQEKTTISSETIAGLISTVPDNAKKVLNIVYNGEKVAAAIAPMSDKIYFPQTPKTVKHVDGKQVTTIEGEAGREIDQEATFKAISTAMDAHEKKVVAVVKVVQPTAQSTKGYSRSSKGINTLISDWVKDHNGSFNVSMQDFTGKISASYNSNTKVTSASIYKLYVADVVYTKAGKGEMSLDGYALPGFTVQECIDVMIIRSDNPCAQALGAKIGWQKNDPFLASQGFTSTTLKSGSFLTTSSDTASLLHKLQSGNLIANSYKDTLLALMKKQIYRNGIPDGSAGSVADKVGFLDALNHDAAVVYHPKGTYVLVIMSSGSSFGNISDLAELISNVMAQ